MVADPWPTLESRERAYSESIDLFERLLPALAEALNAAHFISLSPRFWRILVGPWLIRYVQIMKDRYARLRAAADSRPTPVVVTLDRADRIVPADTLRFTVLAYEDAYNFQLVSSLAEMMGLETLPVRHAGLNARSPSPAAESRLADHLTSLLGASVRFHEIGVSKAQALALVAGSGLCASPLRVRGLQGGNLPWPRRTRIAPSLAARDEFEKILFKALGDDIPACFVENFSGLLELARSARPHGARSIISANGWTFDEPFKAVAGLCAEEGTRLVAVQHGGGYGLYGRMWQEHLERTCTDAYWCWGWASSESDSKLKDVPAASLSLSPDDGSRGDGLLFVTNAQPRYPYGFQSQAQAERCLEGVEDEISFFASLPAGVRTASTVRVTKQDETWGWSAGAALHARFPELRVEVASGPLHERMRHAALTVIDHPATSLLEALALGRPTLLFWRPEIWDCRPSARPALDRLRKAGILFDEPEKASRAAAALWSDPRGWWARPEAREAVTAFRKTLALGSPNWIRDWSAALKEEAER